MRSRPRRGRPAAGAALLVVVACGGDPALDPDGGVPLDAAPAACDRDGIDLAVQAARRIVVDDATGVVLYDGATADGGSRDELSIGHYAAAEPDDAPRSIVLDGTGFAVCLDCVILHAGCGDDGCATSFMAASGALDVAAFGAIGATYAATLTDVRFVEVEVVDGDSVPVVGGQTWCLGELAVEATVAGAGG